MLSTAKPGWRTHTPVEVLDGNLVLDFENSAYVLALVVSRGAMRGQPKAALVRPLVEAGQLAVVDPRAPESQQRISTHVLREYLDRRGAVRGAVNNRRTG